MNITLIKEVEQVLWSNGLSIVTRRTGPFGVNAAPEGDNKIALLHGDPAPGKSSNPKNLHNERERNRLRFAGELEQQAIQGDCVQPIADFTHDLRAP